MSASTQVSPPAPGEAGAPAPHGLTAHSHGAGVVPPKSRAERPAGFDPAGFEALTGREEDWRFTPLDRVGGLHRGAAASGEQPEFTAEVPDGITVEHVARTDSRLGVVGTPEDLVAAHAWANFATAVVLTVPAGTEPADPALLRVTGQGGTSYGHLLLRAEANSRAVVVVDHRGAGVRADNLEVDVADGASLTLVTIQDWADDAVHLSAHHLRLGRDAKIKHVAVTLGGNLVRVAPSARFTAPGGEVEMLGLYFADAGQHLEHRLFVDHAVPNCRSLVTYKGALQGRDAHTVWVGDILIRAGAEGTDTYELNRNLVLTDGARADSVPNLEIETGEIVGAGHASATGRFDDDQLFYLQARGIPELEARRLVVRGFFNQLIQQIGVPEVEQRLVAAIEAELAATMVDTGRAEDVEPAVGR